jgi:hypothetical protein
MGGDVCGICTLVSQGGRAGVITRILKVKRAWQKISVMDLQTMRNSGERQMDKHLSRYDPSNIFRYLGTWIIHVWI